jgi:glucan phosphoethanolaminetransferase (alkaline phosphatase superfamily)
MFKFVWKHIDTNQVKAALAFAIIHCLLFNTAVFIYKFYFISPNILTAILELVKDLVYNLLILFVIFFGLMIHRTLFILASLFLFIASSFASYYLFFLSVGPTPTIIASIFNTHPTEAFEIISTRMIIWLVFSISICLYCIKHFKVQTSNIFFTKFLSAICLLLFVVNIITPKYSFIKTSLPLQYLHNSYVHFFGVSKGHVRHDINTKFSFEDLSDEDTIGVLVIGESARYGNFGINGYERDTTPKLSTIDNLASYKARSCASVTYLSVPCMLSRYGEKDIHLIDSETSILSALTNIGYETILIGTQSLTKHYKSRFVRSFYDEVTFHITPGGSVVILPSSHDENILPFFEQALKTQGKKFIVLHTMGSHWHYAKRYPENFTKFKPAVDVAAKCDASNCGTEQRLNSYDNTILYTDFFLHSVIDTLKDKKAFVIYSSDHGESLGENGRLTHGDEDYVEEQRKVPFMVWFSDSYKNKYPKKWHSIKSEENTEISHDYLFHTILDCLNIKSNAIDKTLSLCQRNINN